MVTNLVARPRGVQESTVRTKSWAEAYVAFLLNPNEHLPTKLLPLAAIGVIPLSLLGDLMLPFVGLLDVIPTSLFVVFAIFRTWRRVRTYR